MNTLEFHKSTMRVLTVLETLASAEEGLTLTEICGALSAPKSSMFPIVHTMAFMDFLSYEAVTGKYSIGVKAYVAGEAFKKSKGLIKVCNEKMHDIVSACSETCQLGILDMNRVLYIDKVESPEPIRLVSDVGKSLPVYCTSLGKALICDYSFGELCKLLNEPFEFYTEKTLKNVEELYHQLIEVKRTDIAYDNGEVIESIDCVAVPIRRQGKVITAISVSTPSYRYDSAKKEVIINCLLEAKRSIEEYLNTSEKPSW